MKLVSRLFGWFLAASLSGAELPNPQEELPAALPNFDSRQAGAPRGGRLTVEGEKAAANLRARVPGVLIDVHKIAGAPSWVRAREGFLSGPRGVGRGIAPQTARGFANDDPDRTVKAFVREHAPLFGHGPEVLAAARKKRDYLTGHNGLRTVVWEQEVDGVPVFDAVFIAHETPNGELVSVSSGFLPEPERAADAGVPNRVAVRRQPPISVEDAITRAATNIGEEVKNEDLRVVAGQPDRPERRRRFKAGRIPGEVEAELVWLPTDRSRLRLCWSVELTRRWRGERFQVLIDAQTGEALLRRCRTFDLSEAGYRVYVSDSPSPLSPGYPVPSTNQPPLVPRQWVTLTALSTNASPLGWINDGDNETRGNNVDAHIDRDGDNLPDLPRPHGAPFRVFDFPLDLSQPPASYREAAVVNLFYWCNWMHDKLYELGFTEAAGNYQKDNFGRGGADNDAIQADAQDSSGLNNANFTGAPDGSPGRVQMFLFTGPDPDRDGSLDTEVMLHELTHGLSDRLVGGGVGITALPTIGLAEGWSDFYAIALLSEENDDLDGVYPAGGYLSRLFSGLTQNYYYGIRRYPYSTDLSKNPLTLKDIDPLKASMHPGIPRSPTSTSDPTEVHHQGEVWCVTLWDARANLIRKHGFSTGNQLILRLVTDGMKLSPPNPNILQARDAILLADQVNTGGVNRGELWAAFAKRGMGLSATVTTVNDCWPGDCTTTVVREQFDVPDALVITSTGNLAASGREGGPFALSPTTFTLVNRQGASINWTAQTSTNWLDLSPADGTLANGATVAVNFSVNTNADLLPVGSHTNTVTFVNESTHRSQTRSAVLEVSEVSEVGLPDYLTEVFGDFVGDNNDLDRLTLTFAPTNSTNFYNVCQMAAFDFPTVPSNGVVVTLPDGATLPDDYYQQVTLTNGQEVAIFGARSNAFYIGSNGDVTFTPGSTNFFEPGREKYFERIRVGGLYADLNPAVGGTVSWKQLPDRAAVTWENVPQYGTTNSNSLQIELFFDGTIRITHLGVAITDPIVGLSAGLGIPQGFKESNLSTNRSCGEPLHVDLPASATEGGPPIQGTVSLEQPVTADLAVRLTLRETEVVALPNVTIFAGETNATFEVSIGDDTELNGTRTSTITASASGYAPGFATVKVYDNESATLTVSVPATTREGDGLLPAQGTITLSAAPERNVSVELVSSDPAKVQVPASVVVPAGQISAKFNLVIGDDIMISGPVDVTVRAHVENWTDGSAVIRVADNDSAFLTLVLPVEVVEGTGVLTNSGMVRLSGTLATNLDLTLLSDNPAAVAVPRFVVISAGQLATTFDVTVGDNNDLDALRMVTVTASASGLTNVDFAVRVLDDETPPLPISPNPPHLSTNNLLHVNLAWNIDHGGASDSTSFDVYFGTNPVFGAAQLVGTTNSMNFDLPVLEVDTTYYWQIVARKGAATTAGPVWQFTTIGVDHFIWSALASSQWVDTPFEATITAEDFRNNVLTNFQGTVQLTGLAPVQTASTILITEIDTGPAGRAEFVNVSSRVLDISGWEIELYDWQAWPAPQVSFVIPGGTLCPTGDVFQLRRSSPQLSPGSYPTFRYGTDIFWNNNPSGSPVAVLLRDGQGNIVDFACAVDANPAEITVPTIIPAAQWKGDPIPANVTQNWTYQRAGYTDHNSRADWVLATNSISVRNADLTLPFVDFTPVSLSPAIITNFVNGVWTGPLTVRETARDMVVRAEDARGHFGAGNVFSTFAPDDDLSVNLPVSPEQIVIGNALTYTVTVSHAGQGTATGVVLTNVLPAGLTFVAADFDEGGCYEADGIVTCDIRELSGTDAVAVLIHATATALGVFTNVATVVRKEYESYQANNVASLATRVGQPFISLADLFVAEGNSGTTNAVITVNLSAPSAQTVTVNYFTRDGTATAGSDYLPAAGTLTFPPGATNGTVNVTVLGDGYDEENETFFVQLADPVNGILQNRRAMCTITNDDAAPFITISDVTVAEGDGGTTNAVFNVTLSTLSEKTATVFFATSNGTALAGLDYLPIYGRLIFPPGITNQAVTVAVLGDTWFETNKTFSVSLYNVFNARFGRSQGKATILDDDSGRLHHFAWNVLASTQFVNRPFLATLTAQDALGNTFNDFNRTVTLSSSEAIHDIAIGNGSAVFDFPLGAAYHDERLQVIYPAGEIGGGGRISALALEVTGAPGQTLSNWTIRLKHTPLAYFASVAWETSGWTTVYQTNLTLVSTGWTTFYFSTPFDYNGTNSLLADFSFNNSSYSLNGNCRATVAAQLRSFMFHTDSAFGDPLTWSSVNAPRPSFTNLFPNVRLTMETAVAMFPERSGKFMNGVWTGEVSVGEPALNLVLRADDGDGHLGFADALQAVPKDTDGDQMPDDWELANGLDPDDPSDAWLDPDQDSFSNLGEYLAGTDPHLADSHLRITGIELSGGTVRVSFTSALGKRYRLEAGGNFAQNGWTTVSEVIGTGGDLWVTDRPPADQPNRFYRIRLVP